MERVERFGYTYTEIKDSPKSQDLANRVFRKYSWLSQAYNKDNSTADVELLKLNNCPVFKYNTGNLESMLSTEFKIVTQQQISKIVAAPTMSSQQVLVSLPEPEVQTAVNVAPLEGLAAKNQPVVTKGPASEDKDLSQGIPNRKDQELLSEKPQGTDVLR